MQDRAEELPDELLRAAKARGARLSKGVKRIDVRRRMRTILVPLVAGESVNNLHQDNIRTEFEYQLWCEASFEVDHCIPDLDVHLDHLPGFCPLDQHGLAVIDV